MIISFKSKVQNLYTYMYMCTYMYVQINFKLYTNLNIYYECFFS